MKTVILFLLASIHCFGQFQDTIKHMPHDEVYQFIEENKQMCLESWRYGVLPSIKMAQAIIESASGTSNICKKANNYFGVKCHTCAKTYNGWRIFEDKKSSFAYINRLYNSMGRYAHLIGEKNIFTWATQLHECGYATSETYPQHLMYNVMLYDLYKIDSIAFKKQEMSEQQFILHDVGFRKDTGLNTTYANVAQEGQDLVRNTITHKSSAKSHPDLHRVVSDLRKHFAGIWKMLPLDLISKDFSDMTESEKSKFQSTVDSITITGVKYIGGESHSKKYIIKAKVELLAGSQIGAVTPQISEDDTRYELACELAHVCEKLRVEVHDYVINKKHAQLSMSFDMEEAGGASDASPLEGV